MKNSSRTARTVLLGAICTCAALPLFGQTKEDIKKSFNVGPGGRLTVESDLGSIEVTATEGNKVDVEVRFSPRHGSQRRLEKFLEDFTVDFDQRGNDVFVTAEYDRDLGDFWDSFGKYVQVEFMITVPKKYNVDLGTSGGSISVGDLEGEADARTSGGSLEFGNIQGAVHGRTSGGSIELDGCIGSVEVRTSGGSISIGRVEGDLVAHTSGGGIRVEEVLGNIDAETSGGSVTAALAKQPDHECILRTSGGGITVYLDKDIRVNLDASTSGGSVRTDFPISIRGRVDHHSLEGKINGGGPDLILRTSGGSISINER